MTSTAPETGMNKLIAQLIEGPETRRHELIAYIRSGRIDDTANLASQLISQIGGTYSAAPVLPSNQAAARRNEIDLTRSWMLTALIWCGRDDPLAAQTISDHINMRLEPNSFVRYWTLGEAYFARVGYLARLVRIAKEDTADEVSTLAQAISAGGGELTAVFRDVLKHGDWNDIIPILRALRFVPNAGLVSEVCGLLGTRNAQVDDLGEVLIALAHPDIVHIAAPLLKNSPGIPRIVRLAIDACSNQRFIPSDFFADLLNAFGEKSIVPALQAHMGNPGREKAAGKLLDSITHGASGNVGLRVAGYSSDAVGQQVDRLGIGAEVRILTAIMLARDVTPPLAIGLFGAWGSGKSFFMNAMRESGERLALQAAATPSSKFCTNVVQIEFNAWHYADTNLWASLATFILDSLAAKVLPPMVDEHVTLAPDLVSAKAETRAAQLEQQAATERLEQDGKSLQALRAQRESRELKLSQISAKEIATLIAADPELKASLSDAFTKLGLPAGWKNIEQLDQTISAALTSAGGTSALFSQLMAPANRKTAILTIILIVAFPIGAFGVNRFIADTELMATVTAVIGQIGVAVIGLTCWLGRGVGVVNASLNQIERAKQHIEHLRARQRAIPTDAETKLAASIETLKAREKTASTNLGTAAARVLEIETRLKELQQETTLARFLSDRTKSDDYRKHLGLISTVRGDFEALAKRLGEPSLSAGANLQVERIVLYIDDLDRCSAAKVVDMLQAVHLLLAYPLFVVVVGVDSRWLLQSLSTHYIELAGTADGSEPTATPEHYLEKIFQIPYSMEPMSDAGYGRLIGELMGGVAPVAPHPTVTVNASAVPMAATSPQRAAPASTSGAVSAPSVGATPELAIAKNVQTGHSAPQLATSALREQAVEVEEDALVLQPWEGSFAATLHPFIPSPRSAKRLSNTYRILKARVPAQRLRQFEGTADAPGEFQVPLLLLAVLISDSKAAARWFRDVLSRLGAGGDIGEMLLGAGRQASDSDYPAITCKVGKVIAGANFPSDKKLLAEWIPQVRRFSFNLARDQP